MTRSLILLLIAVTTLKTTFTQVTAFGSDTLFDVGCWNVEWLGSTEGGPTNENLQFSNVKKVLNGTDVDVWGLAEVSNLTTFNQLLVDLPQYGGVLASYAQTQKTALFYKKDMLEVIGTRHIFSGSTMNYAFAGRPPLEVTLKTVAPLAVDTFYFIVVHLKAFSDQESYNRRKAAMEAMKTYYLDVESSKKIIVLGDFNDDLDESIYNGIVSPFQNIIDDSQNYRFATQEISYAGGSSYASYSGSMIDHILLNKPLFNDYVTTRSKVLNTLPSQISGFTNNTSDHYPVVTSFKFSTGSTVGVQEMTVQEMQIGISVDGNEIIAMGDWSGNVAIYNLNGSIVGQFQKEGNAKTNYSTEQLPKGLYFIHMNANGISKSVKYSK